MSTEIPVAMFLDSQKVHIKFILHISYENNLSKIKEMNSFYFKVIFKVFIGLLTRLNALTLVPIRSDHLRYLGTMLQLQATLLVLFA